MKPIFSIILLGLSGLAFGDAKSDRQTAQNLGATGRTAAVEQARKLNSEAETARKEANEHYKNALDAHHKLSNELSKPEKDRDSNTIKRETQRNNEEIKKKNEKEKEADEKEKKAKEQLLQAAADRKSELQSAEGIKKLTEKEKGLTDQVKNLRDAAKTMRENNQLDAAQRNEAVANSIEKGELKTVQDAKTNALQTADRISNLQGAADAIAADPNSLVGKFVSPEMTGKADGLLAKGNEAVASGTASSVQNKMNDPNLGYSNTKGDLPSVSALSKEQGTPIPANTGTKPTEVFKDAKTGSIWNAPEGYNKLTDAQRVEAFKSGQLSYLKDGQWVKATPTWESQTNAWNLGGANNDFWRPGTTAAGTGQQAGLFRQPTPGGGIQPFNYFTPTGVSKTDNSNPIIDPLTAQYRPTCRIVNGRRVCEQ